MRRVATRRLASLLLVLFTLSGTSAAFVHAQDDTIVPVDPAALFASQIDVVGVDVLIQPYPADEIDADDTFMLDACAVVPSSERRQVYAFFVDAQTSRVGTCDTTTGEQIVFLPDGATGLKISVSPDELYLALLVQQPTEHSDSIYAYTVDISARTLHMQGSLTWVDILNFADIWGWYGQHHVLFTVGDYRSSTPGVHTFVRADAAIPDSLKMFYTQVLDEPLPILDTHLAFAEEGVGMTVGQTLFPCELVRFDPVIGIRFNRIAYDCPGSFRVGDDYYVVRVIEPGSTPRLSLVDGDSAEVTDLWIDPDLVAPVGVYGGGVVAVLKSDAEASLLAFYDLSAQTIVYTLPIKNGTPGEIVFHFDQFGWPLVFPITETTTLLNIPIPFAPGDPYALLLTFEDSGLVRETRLTLRNVEITSLSPDGAIVVAGRNLETSLIDLRTHEETALFAAQPCPELLGGQWCQPDYAWEADDRLAVTFRVFGQGCPDSSICSIRYVVSTQRNP